MSKKMTKNKVFEMQKHAGILAVTSVHKIEVDHVWHTDDDGKYWCGNWYHRTPKQLLSECQTTIRDLLVNHPDLCARKPEDCPMWRKPNVPGDNQCQMRPGDDPPKECNQGFCWASLYYMMEE